MRHQLFGCHLFDLLFGKPQRLRHALRIFEPIGEHRLDHIREFPFCWIHVRHAAKSYSECLIVNIEIAFTFDQQTARNAVKVFQRCNQTHPQRFLQPEE